MTWGASIHAPLIIPIYSKLSAGLKAIHYFSKHVTYDFYTAGATKSLLTPNIFSEAEPSELNLSFPLSGCDGSEPNHCLFTTIFLALCEMNDL